jgi:hypothetical protein
MDAFTGLCCADGARTDARGACCAGGIVDVCGRCNGTAVAVDIVSSPGGLQKSQVAFIAFQGETQTYVFTLLVVPACTGTHSALSHRRPQL